jgi:serine/threonine protein kinase
LSNFGALPPSAVLSRTSEWYPPTISVATRASVAGTPRGGQKLGADLGWVWRDCKPTNLLVDGGTLRPLDFEGAVAVGSDPQLPWGSAGFIPPEWRDADQGRHSVLPSQDLYALGALIHSILAANPPPVTDAPRPIGVHRRGVPREVRALVAALLDEVPTRRPNATDAMRILARAV